MRDWGPQAATTKFGQHGLEGIGEAPDPRFLTDEGANPTQEVHGAAETPDGGRGVGRTWGPRRMRHPPPSLVHQGLQRSREGGRPRLCGGCRRHLCQGDEGWMELPPVEQGAPVGGCPQLRWGKPEHRGQLRAGSRPGDGERPHAEFCQHRGVAAIHHPGGDEHPGHQGEGRVVPQNEVTPGPPRGAIPPS